MKGFVGFGKWWWLLLLWFEVAAEFAENLLGPLASVKTNRERKLERLEPMNSAGSVD
jgi:hypothetical protein